MTRKKIEQLTNAELNSKITILEAANSLDCRFRILSREEPLPYDFDLVYDIKEWSEVDEILAGKAHRSGIDANDLREFAQDCEFLLESPTPLPFTTDWVIADQIVIRLLVKNQLTLSDSAPGLFIAACTDLFGVRHSFTSPSSLVAMMRCRLILG